MALGNVPARKPATTRTTPMSGFRLNEDQPTYRLISNVQGIQKTGKNHLAFTAPGAIAVQSFDIGLEGVVEKFNSQKQIFTAEYELENQPSQREASTAVEAEANRLWDKFSADYMDACATESIRTIVWDTGSEVWELCRLKNFGKLSANSQHYGPVNAEFRRLFRIAYDHNKNFVAIHQMKDEWKEGVGGKNVKSGRLERTGFKEIGFMVQINIQTWRDEANEFHATILDCRQNPAVNGMDLTGDMLNYTTLGQMVFPESTEADWI